MKRIVNMTGVQLALFLVVLILMWSVIVRFPWIVAVAVLIFAIFLIANQQKGARR